MKNFTFLLIFSLLFFGFSRTQVIEDFEGTDFSLRSGASGDKSSFTLVPNPDPTGINTSGTVLKFVRSRDFNNWTAISGLVNPFWYDETQYYHVKVWKPRISQVMLGFISYGYWWANSWLPINSQSVANGWEELVFNIPSKCTAQYLEFVPDYTGNEGLTADVVLYVDDITMNHDPAVGSAPEVVFADFEHIPLNLMLGGAEDKSAMAIVANPDTDTSGVNLSRYVIQYTRDKDGVVWGGFWSALPQPLDLTINKYMHVKVWKSRISPLKFKIEGGAAGTLEVASKYPQTKVNAWEDLVFDLSEKTGLYPTIAFMPDFEDPLTLTEDLVLYFDDFLLNNDPLPRKLPEVVINADLTGTGNLSGSKVYISGDFGGIYGNWAIAGTNPACEMTDPDGDGIYTIRMKMADRLVSFRFNIKPSGSVIADEGTSVRTHQVNGDAELTYKWQLGGLVVAAEEPKIQVFTVDMSGAGLAAGQKVYVSGTFGGKHGTWDEPGTNSQNELTDPDSDGKYSITLDLPDGTYSFKFFKGSGWGGGEWPGDPNRSYTANGSKSITFRWGLPGMKFGMDNCNLITDGGFDADDPLLSAWYAGTTWEGFSEVAGGVLALDKKSKGGFGDLEVLQKINDFGRITFKDSAYMLAFDAWASRERVNSFVFEDNIAALGLSQDDDAYNNMSRWDIHLTTGKTSYVRTFTGRSYWPNSVFKFMIQSGADTGTVFIDNVRMFKLSDLKNYGELVSGITVTGEGGATTITTDKGTLQMNALVLPDCGSPARQSHGIAEHGEGQCLGSCVGNRLRKSFLFHETV